VLERLTSSASLRSWKVLRTFDFTSGRGDLHFGIGPEGGVDCTHSCYSPFRAEPLLWRVSQVVESAVGDEAAGRRL
jgi:hypothetical protein